MEDRCICCGEVIPEGRQVCILCENGIVMGKRAATRHEKSLIRVISKDNGLPTTYRSGDIL